VGFLSDFKLVNNIIMMNLDNFSLKHDRKKWIFILIIFLINILIKGLQITHSSIWLDEAHTATQSLKSISQIINESANDQNPPVYFIIMHFWTKVFGISEFGIRSFSLLMSLVSVVLLFFFAERHFGLLTAVVASFLFTFSQLQIYFSIEARSFALVGLLSLISFAVFLRMIKKPRLFTGLILALVNTMMIYSHFISAFIIPVQLSFVLLFYLKNKRVLKAGLTSVGVTMLLFLPWLSNLYSNLPEAGVYWLTKPTFYNLKGLFISFSNGKVMTVIFFLVILISIWLLLKGYRTTKLFLERERIIILSLLWFLLPVFADYIISSKVPVFLNKYLLYCSLPFYFLIGYSLSELQVSFYLKSTVIIVIITLFIVLGNLKVEKTEDWRSTSAYLKQINAKEQKKVILSAACISMPFAYYYDRRLFENYSHLIAELSKRNFQMVDRLVQDSSLNVPSLVLVESHLVDPRSSNNPKTVISQEYKEVQRNNFGDIEVFVFEKISGRQ